MNNNDTNNSQNNGLNPNGFSGPQDMQNTNLGNVNDVNQGAPVMNSQVNLMNQTPVQPVNDSMGQVNPMMNQGQDMQGMSLGSFEEAQNTAPQMITPEPTPAVQPMNQGMDLLNQSPAPVSPITPDPMSVQQSQNTVVTPQPTELQTASFGNLSEMNSNPQPMNGGVNLSSEGAPSIVTPQGQPMMDNSMNVGTSVTPDMNFNGQTNSFNSAPQPDMMNNGLNQAPVTDPFGNNAMGMQQPGSSMDNNPFGQPNMGMNPNMNGNVFGTVPTPPVGPVDGKQKKGGKLKFSKTSILLIAVLVIAIIGVAVWYILNNASTTQTKGEISTKDLVLELGQPLSSDISDYALLTGFNASTCTLDTSKVNTKRMGSYEYTVTCGSTSRIGSIVLQDKTAPVVTTKEVMVVPGTMVNISDFIVACNDYTECSYELEDSTQSLETLTATEGNYNLNLKVSDEYDNQTTVTLSLVVSESAPVRYMYCTPTETQDDTLKASLATSYNYGINMDDLLAKTDKTYVYTFDSEEDYLAAKNSYSATTGINGIIGSTVFDDTEFTISITVSMTDSELGTEFNLNPFPTDYEGLRQFNLDQGITCKNR